VALSPASGSIFQDSKAISGELTMPGTISCLGARSEELVKDRNFEIGKSQFWENTRGSDGAAVVASHFCPMTYGNPQQNRRRCPGSFPDSPAWILISMFTVAWKRIMKT